MDKYFTPRKFPVELTTLKHWVVYRRVPNGSKPDGTPRHKKVPYYTNGTPRSGKQGSPDDLAQLATYEDALNRYNLGGLDGLGIAILPGCGVVALDFDDCVKEGKVDFEVLRMVDGTYAEFSPSGKGVRAFYEGNNKSFKRNCPTDSPKLEVFGSDGFVTITGSVLDPDVDLFGVYDQLAPLPEWVGERSRAQEPPSQNNATALQYIESRLGVTIDQLRETLEDIQPDCERSKWFKVLAGTKHEFGDTEFEHQALELIVDWSRGEFTPSQEEPRNYDSDGDVRREWNTLVSNPSGKRPITFKSVLDLVPRDSKRAVEDVNVTPNAQRFKRLTADDVKALPPLEWLVKGLIPESGMATLFGKPGSGKSFVAIDLACAVAAGLPWFGRKVKQADVAYICLEGAAGLQVRIGAYEKHHQRTIPSNLKFITEPLNLMVAQDLIDLVPTEKLIFIDTLNRASPTADENTSKDMGIIIQAANTISTRTGGLVILVHHSGKDQTKGPRGHSSLTGALDCTLEIDATDATKIIHIAKLKDGSTDAKLYFELIGVTLGHDRDGDAVTSCAVHPCNPMQTNDLSVTASEVLSCLDASLGLPVPERTWREGFYKLQGPSLNKRVHGQQFRRALFDLQKAGVVVKTKDGWTQTNNDSDLF
jgi:hypothetical protein